MAGEASGRTPQLSAHLCSSCHSFTSLFPGTKLYHGSLEELYLPQEPQVASGQPLHHPHKMCKSVSTGNVKACSLKSFKEGPGERSHWWMTEVAVKPGSMEQTETLTRDSSALQPQEWLDPQGLPSLSQSVPWLALSEQPGALRPCSALPQLLDDPHVKGQACST